MLRRRMNILIVTLVLIVREMTQGQLIIRPLHVYKNIIQGIHDYFNNTCIILLHATSDPVETQGLEVGDSLLNLQRYLSGSLHIRTSIMDFDMFKKRVGQSYYHIKRPLFIILADYDNIRDHFAHVSTWIAMDYPTWLIFFREKTKIDEFFQKIYIPFDCKCMIAKTSADGKGEIITEVYQIAKGTELKTMTFGFWDSMNGFKGSKLAIYKRRKDLHGQAIRVVSVHDPPLSLMLRNSNDEIIGYQGFFGEVLKLLQEGMNCTFVYLEAESWGMVQPNGTWTGVIGMLMRNEADLAATGMMMTRDRLDIMKFTNPVYVSKCRTFIKRPDSTAVKWKTYTAPFDAYVWHSVGLLVVLTSLAIFTIKAILDIISYFQKDYENSPTRFSEIMFSVFGVFCSQGMQASLLDPIRMVHLVIHLTGVVVLAAYSAALISFLALQSFDMPFTTMEGLLKDGTYRFAVIGDSSDYSFFQNTRDSVLSILFDNLLAKETELPINYLEGLRRICENNKYAFMTQDNIVAELRNEVDCTLDALDTMMQQTVAMGVRRDNPYLGVINYNILLIRDSGLLQRVLSRGWSNKPSRTLSEWDSVKLNDMVPLLLFMLCAFISSCILLFLEYTIHRRLAIQRTLKNAQKSDKRKNF